MSAEAEFQMPFWRRFLKSKGGVANITMAAFTVALSVRLLQLKDEHAAEKERLTDEVATLTASVDELSSKRGWFGLASGGRGGGVAAKGDAAKSSRAARGGSDSSTGGAAEAKKALAKLRDGKIML